MQDEWAAHCCDKCCNNSGSSQLLKTILKLRYFFIKYIVLFLLRDLLRLLVLLKGHRYNVWLNNPKEDCKQRNSRRTKMFPFFFSTTILSFLYSFKRIRFFYIILYKKLLEAIPTHSFLVICAYQANAIWKYFVRLKCSSTRFILFLFDRSPPRRRRALSKWIWQRCYVRFLLYFSIELIFLWRADKSDGRIKMVIYSRYRFIVAAYYCKIAIIYITRDPRRPRRMPCRAHYSRSRAHRWRTRGQWRI